ncbi:MAG: hypothetical protein Fur0037_14640 [Planctomycetota bacterium]
MTARNAKRILLAGALALGAWRAFDRAWLCDDAFISFRYAHNLVAGQGLVFNAGERVEGFSNPSWTLLCAAAEACSLDPVSFAQGLGILCFLATGVVLAALSGPFCLPLAALGFLAHRHAAEFASCGLETSFYTLLVLSLFGMLARARGKIGFAAAGALAGLVAITRPEGALLGFVAGSLCLFGAFRERKLVPAVSFAIPAMLLFGGWLAFRLAYYGDWLPNTYYAKSGGDPYLSQGFEYVVLFFESYWILAPALPALPFLFLDRTDRKCPRVAAAAAACLAFPIWVGGDFMFARFLIPATPLLYLTLERWIRGRSLAVQGAAVALTVLGTLLMHEHEELRGVGSRIGSVGDEREQYPAERTRALRASGAAFRAALEGSDARVAFSGTQAMLVYEARFAYALEAATGLTDRYLARRPLARRGPIGHEKNLRIDDPRDRAYLLEKRVQFLLERYPLPDSFAYRRARLFGTDVTIVTYDREVMRRLSGRPGAEFVDFEQYLDAYLGSIPELTVEEVRSDYEQFRLYYFQWNEDPARERRFAEFLKGR